MIQRLTNAVNAGVERIVAALYVGPRGVYFGIDGVDPWDEERDARLYKGPHPVVAHPPCARWGRYWFGGPSARVRRRLGDDGGCFAAAIEAVRRWGGVLEHPEASKAWPVFGLNTPPRGGGWVRAGLDDPGWTCCVEQGHYGHRARKATWLYAVGTPLPSLRWGPGPGERMAVGGAGYHSAEERQAARWAGTLRAGGRMSKRACSATPPEFRDVLLGMARGVERMSKRARSEIKSA